MDRCIRQVPDSRWVDEIKVGFGSFPCFWPLYCSIIYYNMKTDPAQYPKLEQQRQTLLRRLSDLRELRRGSLTEQFLTVKHADGSSVRRGPYPLLSRKDANKTVSVRVTDPGLVPLYRQQIQTMRQFESVVEQLARVGEQLGDLAVAEVMQKKTSGGVGAKRRSASPGRSHGQAPSA